MSHGSPKVYVIKTPGNRRPPQPTPPSPRDNRSSRSKPAPPRNTDPAARPGRSAKPLLLAYLAGPVTASRWLTGRSRALWASLGFASVLIGFALLMLRSRFDAWVETTSGGLLGWLLIVPPLVLVAGAVWARSVAAAGRMHPVAFSRLPRRLRSPAAVAAAGAVVPGLGLMLTGRHRLAGWSFLLAGATGATGAVFVRWHWLWDRSRTPVPPGLSGPALEVVFAATLAIALVAGVLWVVQALDGARRVSTSRSPALAQAASLALLASLVVFAAAFRPATVAGNLHQAAVALRADGYRMIPLGLNEAAFRLDPATPAYLAETVELYGAAGMWEEAQERRRLLEAKARAYTRLAFGEGGALPPPASAAAQRSAYVDDPMSPYHQLHKLKTENGPRRRRR